MIPRRAPACLTILSGASAPGLLGACAAGGPADVSTLARVAIFLLVTAAVAALVYGIWHFLATTPVPVSRKDNYPL